MIKSMTGFGRAEISNNEHKLIVEIKSVNHRYGDYNIKLPKKLSFFESEIRNILKSYIQRGKVDVFIIYEDYTEGKACVKYNEGIANEYYRYLNVISEKFGIENKITASSLARYPDVFTLEEQALDESEIKSLVEATVKKACESFIKTRMDEGENLKKDLIDKLKLMLTQINFIEERTPAILKEYRTKLETKVRDLLNDAKIDESMLLTEVAIFADKMCVDEEIIRLKSHIVGTEKALKEGTGVGRKLDFIAQEMNREANTILSKSNDLEVSNIAIDLKTEIEKIREQIQNIE